MSLYDESLPVMNKQLGNLDSWLGAAIEAAEARGYDPEVLVEARLYPDQFPLRRQIQSACDTAKFTASRLAGVEAPSHPDTEKTLAELRARIQATRDYLDGFDGDKLAGANERKIAPSFLQGAWVYGVDYLREFALPNFMFHTCMAYAILRHNGVPLGKRAYLGSMTIHPPE